MSVFDRESNESQYLVFLIKILIKIAQTITFDFLGRKITHLLPGQKKQTLFLPRTSSFLPAGDTGGDINNWDRPLNEKTVLCY